MAIIGGRSSAELAMEIAGHLNEALPIPYHMDVVDYKRLTHQELKDHIDRIRIIFYRRLT